MSTYAPRDVACAACGHVERRAVAESVNIARSDKPRAGIVARTFHRYTCDTCGKPTVVDAPFTYIDLPRKQLFGQYPRAWASRWRQLEEELRGVLARNLADPSLPPFVRALGEGVTLRVVFGLEALREKIVCFEAGVDDVTLEALKLALARDGAGWAATPAAQLRLLEADASRLRFARALDGLTLDVPRAEYDRVAGDAYAAVRSRLADGPYVDVAKILPLS